MLQMKHRNVIDRIPVTLCEIKSTTPLGWYRHNSLITVTFNFTSNIITLNHPTSYCRGWDTCILFNWCRWTLSLYLPLFSIKFSFWGSDPTT